MSGLDNRACEDSVATQFSRGVNTKTTSKCGAIAQFTQKKMNIVHCGAIIHVRSSSYLLPVVERQMKIDLRKCLRRRRKGQRLCYATPRRTLALVTFVQFRPLLRESLITRVERTCVFFCCVTRDVFYNTDGSHLQQETALNRNNNNKKNNCAASHGQP